VVNHTLEPRSGLKARARVLAPSMRLLFEKRESAAVAANAYRDVFELPRLADLPPVYFVRLDLTDAAGKRISDNLYWFPAQKGGSLEGLRLLPPAKLAAKCEIQIRGSERVARVKVANPGAQLAFFVQLALTRGRGGSEILPVLWDDNYFSLLPGESREVTAVFAAKDAGSAKPTLEIGGWNVETDLDCPTLTVSSKVIKVGESITVVAGISNTFLDGSRVTLRQDGQPVASQVAWARGAEAQKLEFPLKLDRAGKREIVVGGQKLTLNVQP
jgi:hypothetical protein